MRSIFKVALLLCVLCFVHSFTIQASFEKQNEDSDNSLEQDEFTVSTLIEKANADLERGMDGSLVMFGDVLVKTGLQNADPCTQRSCLWPKSGDGTVNIPYRLSNAFSEREQGVIMQAFQSFAESTCIRFMPWRRRERDFLNIISGRGCYSYVGRRGSSQELSLQRNGCIFLSTVQHELLHALGFHHEQTRSDRDEHVEILLENVLPGREGNFDIVNTLNLNTTYDYGSVMHYGRFAFSQNRRPTIVPIPDPDVPIGRATEMSPLDIIRVNRLYGCSAKAGQGLDMLDMLDMDLSGQEPMD